MSERIITLEDQGQDFLELLVDERNEITEARPFQGWLWKGFQIVQKHIEPGMRLRLRKRGQRPIILKYPVVSVRVARPEVDRGK